MVDYLLKYIILFLFFCFYFVCTKMYIDWCIFHLVFVLYVFCTTVFYFEMNNYKKYFHVYKQHTLYNTL